MSSERYDWEMMIMLCFEAALACVSLAADTGAGAAATTLAVATTA